MSYERKDIPELIGAFRAARSIVSEGYDHYLCHALGWNCSSANTKAGQLVRRALGSSFTLESWFYAINGVYPDWGQQEAARMRVRWCNKIIRDLREYAKTEAPK